MIVDVLTIVGNPKVQSRTGVVAEAVASLFGTEPSASRMDVTTNVETMEVAPLGPHLLGWGSSESQEALERLMSADILVVASPVFKATYTGLLKLLFDQVGAGALEGRVAIPVMVGAGPAHALAIETHLRPLLVEVGASCPTAGLYVLDSDLGALDAQLDTWAQRWVPVALGAAVAGLSNRQQRKVTP
jgi:FMN reductase